MKNLKLLIIIIIIIFSIFTLGCLNNSLSVNSNDDIIRNHDRSIISDNNDKEEPNTGSISVRVLDNLIRYPTHIQIYKNGEFVQSVYMSEGKHIFRNLEYGIYKFEVNDPDFITWWCDAFPAQNNYDNEIGEVELSSQINTISYVINGDNPKTNGSGLDSSPAWYDRSDTPTGHYLYQKVKLIRGLLGIC